MTHVQSQHRPRTLKRWLVGSLFVCPCSSLVVASIPSFEFKINERKMWRMTAADFAAETVVQNLLHPISDGTAAASSSSNSSRPAFPCFTLSLTHSLSSREVHSIFLLILQSILLPNCTIPSLPPVRHHLSVFPKRDRQPVQIQSRE